MHKTNKSSSLLSKYFYLIPISIVFLFLLILNILFPSQSDDMGYRELGGFSAAIDSYLHKNPRFGEIIKVSFGAYYSKSFLFDFCNSIIGTLTFSLIFILFKGRLPKKEWNDIICFSTLIVYALFDPIFKFGSVFYWTAGSLNYLLFWFLILSGTNLILLFWRNVDLSNSSKIIVTIFSIPIGILAGWCSEFAIVFIVLYLFSLIFGLYQKKKFPIYYYFLIVSLIIGWLILYKAPGIQERASMREDYLSLGTILHSGIKEILILIIKTFSNFTKVSCENFFWFFLLTFISLCNSFSIKKGLVVFFDLLISISLFFFTGELFFILFMIISCFFYYFYFEKNYKKIYLLFGILLLIECLFIGSTIQIGIPGRARFQFTIINSILACIVINQIFETYSNKSYLLKTLIIINIFITFVSITFVIFECTYMRIKWTRMESSINEQIEKGIEDIVVSKNTFKSLWWGYGDWGNPDEFTDEWPDTIYADYYGVSTFAAK